MFPGQTWTEVIMSEVHDISRAVDGLGKEIYLGLIFIQLQVRPVPPRLYANRRRRRAENVYFLNLLCVCYLVGFVSRKLNAFIIFPERKTAYYTSQKRLTAFSNQREKKKRDLKSVSRAGRHNSRLYFVCFLSSLMSFIVHVAVVAVVFLFYVRFLFLT